MNEYLSRCPCCNKQLKISIDGSGEITTVFFDDQNQDDAETIKLLQEKGIYFGCKGGD